MIDLVNELQQLPTPYVVMSVGIPGSGKTTVLAEMAKELEIARISPDDIRQELTGSVADQSANTKVWIEAYNRAQVALAAGQSVIMDATHAEAWRRPGTVADYRAWGAAAVVAIVFDVPLAVAKQRNAGRERVVSGHALTRMHQALAKELVSLQEGFDRIFRIAA